jgi:fructokinase
VSGRAFARDYARHASADLAERVDLRPAQIVERMRAGDRPARLVWQRYVDRVGRGLSLVLDVLDPDAFVMGGGMSNVVELSTPTCRRCWRATRSRRCCTRRCWRRRTATPAEYAARPGCGSRDR